VHIAEMNKRTIAYAGEITSNGARIATAVWRIACVSRLPDGSIKSTDIPADVAGRLEPYYRPSPAVAHRASHIARRPSNNE
jgi:hypothetical protein